MISKKFARPLAYAVISILLAIDFCRASIGVSSFVALTRIEATAGTEFLLICVLLWLSYQQLRLAQVRGILIHAFFIVWFAALGLVIELAMISEEKIGQHWDAQVTRLVNEGNSSYIKQVSWNINVHDIRKQCVIIKKERIRLLSYMFKYQIMCSQPQTLLNVTLSINVIEGNANAYIDTFKKIEVK